MSVIGFILLILALFLSMPWWISKLTQWDAKFLHWHIGTGFPDQYGDHIPRGRAYVLVGPVMLCASLLNYSGSGNNQVFVLFALAAYLLSLLTSSLGTALKHNLRNCRLYLGAAIALEILLLLGFHCLPAGNSLACFFSLVVAIAIGVMGLYCSDKVDFYSMKSD